MKSKVPPQDSWRLFWIVQAVLAPFAWLLSTLLRWRPTDGSIAPTFGQAALLGLVITAGVVASGVIFRAIMGSSNGSFPLYFFFLFPFIRPYTPPFSEVLRRHILLVLYLIPFVAFYATLWRGWWALWRGWTRRKSRLRTSPMADAEVDALPIARTSSRV